MQATILDYDDHDDIARRFALNRRVGHNQPAMRPAKVTKQRAKPPEDILDQVEGEEEFVMSLSVGENEQFYCAMR